MTQFIVLTGISFFLFITSCAPMPNVQPKQKSNLTVGMVKTQVKKGLTNQAEILKLFGAPNLVTQNRNDDEVWNYSKMSFESGSGVASDVWFGSRALSTTTTSSFDLIIIFDKDSIVKEYSIISASY
jgi:outer membrane protein assembly factor BamE (lipoprotein component of BamABCDE complex)